MYLFVVVSGEPCIQSPAPDQTDSNAANQRLTQLQKRLEIELKVRTFIICPNVSTITLALTAQ